MDLAFWKKGNLHTLGSIRDHSPLWRLQLVLCSIKVDEVRVMEVTLERKTGMTSQSAL